MTKKSDAEWLADQATLSATGTSTGKPGAAAFLPSLIDQLAPTVHAQGYVQPDFAYDSSYALRSIAVPAVGGTSRNPITRKIYFDYQDRALTFNFDFLSTYTENVTCGQSLHTLRHIYSEISNGGYLLSYSDYGMVYNVSMRTQMSISFLSDPYGTISDGTGTLWSCSYTYTDFHAVQKKTDARGVETHYKYDALNRLVQVWYTGIGGDDQGTVRPALPAGRPPSSGSAARRPGCR